MSSNQSELVLFQFQEQDVRTITDQDNNPWFVGKDVCEILEISKYRDMLEKMDDDEKRNIRVSTKTDTLGGHQDMICLNMEGVYELIFKSDKPKAKLFRKWLKQEVLPSIAKTGSYSVAPKPQIIVIPAPPDPLIGRHENLSEIRIPKS